MFAENGLAFIVGLFFIPVVYGLYKIVASFLLGDKKKSKLDSHEYKRIIAPFNKGRSIDCVVENLNEYGLSSIQFELNNDANTEDGIVENFVSDKS